MAARFAASLVFTLLWNVLGGGCSGSSRSSCASADSSVQESIALVQLRTKASKAGGDTDLPLNQTETDFIAGVLTSFGKQSPSYNGPQVLQGFRSGFPTLMDEQGMFAFDESVKSVAIDVGAANNPLIFDMDADASQLVLAFEPVFDKQLEKDFERVADEVIGRGGCKNRWDSFCVNQRLVLFPSAMAPEVGHATFHLAANPYCSSMNNVPGGLDQSLLNHPDPEVSDVMKACWGSLDKAEVKTVPAVTLASILRRIPKNIRIKYIKIDAQGEDFKILMSAAEQMPRIEYVRFEMQVDPPAGRKMVADIPSYAEVEKTMKKYGFVHKSPKACYFDQGSSAFSKAIKEQECVFCRELPCAESGVPPLGKNPRELVDQM